MAQSSGSKLKEWLLIGFLIASVVLVAFHWMDGIIGGEEDVNPAYIRATPANFQVDDSAYEQWNSPDPTQTPQP